ncbi:HupE/UreJ family protein [Cohnella lupini]|uniref:Hydrogenase/urease accessory protein HupE n=1 Tax=Cohnella lupini TaxID=1294267 RepID=A0A3D9I0K0_9BACL|nr:HupE/UreJ family protein [Cohnella lupini]RED55298.1 hydrogenase/urease accessory protein HupE [Cohnella lupini]
MSKQWFIRLASMFLIAVFLLKASPVSAHEMNLGGSKWAIEKDRIVFTIDLGYQLFPQIEGIKDLGYDLEHLSDEQLGTIITDVIQPYINEKLSVSVNESLYPVKVDRIERDREIWNIWLEINDISFDQQDNKVKIDYHLLFNETKNDHINVGTIYFTNADDESLQETFNYTQPNLYNTFTPSNTTWEFSMKSKPPSVWSKIYDFIVLGIEHILSGFDHIAFLVALIVIGLTTREALKIITAFTVAHSITLLLSALQVVTLNSRFVESMIALSICYVAIENIWKKQAKYRWIVTFAFGLMHGFGFASVLQDYVKGKSDLVLSVVSFNVGVEVGQLMIFLVLLPVLYLLKKKIPARQVTIGVSAVIFILGLGWLIGRVFDMQLLPF